MTAIANADAPQLATLRDAVGAGEILTGEAMEPYITDVYRRLETPIAVVRPSTVDALQAVVKQASDAGLAIYARGGGASYTDGYLPKTAQSVLIDTSLLNRIVEINAEDAYVTVEAGVTWAQLKAALDPLGLRTPFFGPFSGFAASIGGAMSQNALSHGSGAHGVSAQSLQSLDVVIASGELISTGTAGRGSTPHMRFYGPDLAGLFTGDCGVLGVKARITLPLLRRKPAFAAASFGFATLSAMAEAMRDAAMEQLDDEHFALDAALSQGQIARQGNADAVFGMAKAVMASSANVFAGAAQLARMALAGTKAMKNNQFMVHFIIEGVNDAEVRAKLGRLRQLMAAGSEIPNTVPTVVRGMPFGPLINTLGPAGERWAPLHGVIAHSKVAAFHEALMAFYAARQEQMTKVGVWYGGMFETVGTSGFLYEVAHYWPGVQTAYHKAAVPADYLAGLKAYPDNPEATALIEEMRAGIIELYGRYGAGHFQIGKVYPYGAALSAETLNVMKSLKAALDPKGLMNPGALGL